MSSIMCVNQIKEREEKCINELKTLVKGERMLENCVWILSDEFLLHFVRGKKYDSKKAFETLINYMNVRRVRYADLFRDLRPSRCPVESNLIRVFRNRDASGRMIGVFQFKYWEAGLLSFDEIMQNAVVYFEEAWMDLNTEEHGCIVILDTKGFSFAHARHCTPNQVQKLIHLFWNSFPMKHYQIHILNSPFCFTTLYNLVKRFLPLKLRERIVMHGVGSKSGLEKYLCPDIVPDNLGGNLPEQDAYDEDFARRILDKEEYYRIFAAKLEE